MQILAAKQFIETHKDRRSPTVPAPTLAGFNIASSLAKLQLRIFVHRVRSRAYAVRTYVCTCRIAPVW